MTEDSDSPYRKSHHQPPPARKSHERHASTTASAKPKQSTSSSRRPRGRRRRKPGGAGGAGGGAKGARSHASAAGAKTARSHTSHPTTRAAQVSTREWLLQQYGPVCAYCGGRFAPRKMTLDHVAPRRGQSAYDRRDNLVLACGPCNAAKRDQSPLAYLLGVRSRAVNLVKFGAHLSQGLIDMARSLIPGHLESSARHKIDYSKWGPTAKPDDDDSPYK